MAEGYVAVNGTMRRVKEQFVAVNGTWRSAPTAFVAVNGTMRTAFSGVPKFSLSAVANATAPYSRLSYSYYVEGHWQWLQVLLVAPGNQVTQLRSYGATSGAGSTVSESGVTAMDLVPNTTYTVVLWHRDQSGRDTWLDSKNVTLSSPPYPRNWRYKYPITHNSGGVEWDSSPDVDDWESQNLTLGQSWRHGGNIPYIYYNGGLSHSTTYWVTTRSIVNGVYGPWYPNQYFGTGGAPYAAGEHWLPRGHTDTYQTGQSGGQAAGWQNNSRSTWYSANGAYWGSTRGVQKTCFFYDQNHPKFIELRNAFANGARCNRAWLYVQRDTQDAGNGGAVPVIYSLHNSALPNPPGNVSGNATGPSLGKGGGAWVEVSAHWATLVVTQPHPYTGFMVGDSNDRNHYMAISKTGQVGTISFEIV